MKKKDFWMIRKFARKSKSFLAEYFRFLKTTFKSYGKRLQIKKDFSQIIFENERFPLVTKYFISNEEGLIPVDRHYFYHPSWAARVLFATQPEKHVDISSILTFVGYVSAFIPIDYYEYNLPDIELDNLATERVDLMNLPFKDDSLDSLSCMHVVEHVGLGRYGDKVDINGDLKAANELKRVLANEGTLLFVVPVSDNPRIEFNAHRVYSYKMVIDMFAELHLEEFALIPDKKEQGGLIRYAKPEMCSGQSYACGCFHFVKRMD